MPREIRRLPRAHRVPACDGPGRGAAVRELRVPRARLRGRREAVRGRGGDGVRHCADGVPAWGVRRRRLRVPRLVRRVPQRGGLLKRRRPDLRRRRLRGSSLRWNVSVCMRVRACARFCVFLCVYVYVCVCARRKCVRVREVAF
jgi:hypothetical protein